MVSSPTRLHARVMRHVDHVGDVLEIDVGIAAHEDDFLGAPQINFREARFQILPAHVILIDLHRRRLIFLRPHHLNDDRA